MPGRMLVPLDGSALSEEVVPWVDELAAAMGAGVELARVLGHDSQSEAVLGEVALNERLSTGSAAPGASTVDAVQAEAREQEARLALS
jgi:nucleotide-binding universal stress UspA family protein